MDTTLLPLCYTTCPSIYISLNFARKWQRKLVMCISKLVCAGTSEDTVYVNFNKTIQTFWYLTLPLPAINVAWLVMNTILNNSV